MQPSSHKAKSALRQWRELFEQVGRFWHARGRLTDMLREPYTHVALVLVIISFHQWVYDKWWELPLSILPNVIGFSLGGYAILLAFGDSGFSRVLGRSKDEPDPKNPSVYITVSAIFLHFIIFQVAALCVAIIAKSLDFPFETLCPSGYEPVAWFISLLNIARIVFGAFGFFLFIYSLCLAAAAAISVFGLSEWFEEYLASRPNDKDS